MSNITKPVMLDDTGKSVAQALGNVATAINNLEKVQWGQVKGTLSNQTDLNNNLNSLQSQIDSFTALSPGSTTGDAELTNIRVDSAGHTYSTAGDAVRAIDAQVRDMKTGFDGKAYSSPAAMVQGEDANLFDYEKQLSDYGIITLFPSAATYVTGGVTFTFVRNGEYAISASNNTYAINYECFMSNNSFPDGISAGKTYGVFVENDDPSGIQFQLRPYAGGYLDGDQYHVSNGYKEITIPANATGVLFRIHVESGQSYSDKHFKVIISDKLNKQQTINEISEINTEIGQIYTGGEKTIDLVYNSNGYISSITGEITTGGYNYSDPYAVKPGEKYKYVSNGSTSTFAFAMYANSTDTKADMTKSIPGDGTTNEKTVVIPEGINYIRMCYSTGGTADHSLKKVIPSLDNLAINMQDVDNKIAALDVTGVNYTLIKRKPCVSFIFDDGNANDATIKGVFDTKNKKCGFAIYTGSSTYKNYYDQGYEILAHAVNPISGSATDEEVLAILRTAYNTVYNLVGECHGWVTPSSAMPTAKIPLVYDVFEYGYTISKGDVITPSDAVMAKTIKSYELWRSSIESLSVAEIKAILDYAVSNNAMVCIYGHAANLGNTFTTSDLAEIIDYCDTNGIEVLRPYECTLKFLSFRHNEDIV